MGQKWGVMQAPFADPLSGPERLRPTLPIVGRNEELQTLLSLLDTVQHDWPAGAHALTISGGMGIGKTRLLAALYQEARERGFLVLSASAFESGAMFPYFPFIEALRPVLSSLPLAQLRRFMGLPPFSDHASPARERDEQGKGNDADPIALTGPALVAALAHLFPSVIVRLGLTRAELLEQEILTPEQEKFRILDAIATLLEHMTVEQPILLSLDNLQWADSASIELMLYLTIRLHVSRIALVGATRPPHGRQDQGDDNAMGPAAAMRMMKVLGDLVRQGMLVLMPLGPLAAEAATQHLHWLLPSTMPLDVMQPLLTRAEGNPFFLEELVRALALHPEYTTQEGGWREKPIRRMLPESIVLAVGQRLQSLSRACHDLLHAAALFGRSFPVEALTLSVEQRPDKVQALIDEATQALIIAPVPASEQDDTMDDASQAFPLPQPQQTYLFC